MIIEAKQGDRADFRIWAETGKDKGVVERVLDVNPGLADVMFDLPIGYTFVIPPELLKTAPTKQVQRLW